MNSPPYRKDNPYKREENPYLKKNEGNPFFIKRQENKYNKDDPINRHQRTKNPVFDVEISDPIITNPKNPKVTEVDRFRLRNIPIHKENPYLNWKFSTIKDIDQNHEAKCVKTTMNGHNIRIDAFTVTPKPGGESNDDANEGVKEKQIKFDADKPKENEPCKRRNSTQESNPLMTRFKTTNFGNETSSENSVISDETGWTSFTAVVDDDLPKKDLSNSYDESNEKLTEQKREDQEELEESTKNKVNDPTPSDEERKEFKETVEIAEKAETSEPERPITSDQNIVNTNTQSPRSSSMEIKTEKENDIIEKKSSDPNEKFETLQKQLRLLFESQKLGKESNQIAKNNHGSELKENIKPTTEEEKSDQKGSDISDKSGPPIMDKKVTNFNATKNIFWPVGMGTMNEKKAGKQQNKVEKKYSTQLNIKLNGKIGYDHSVTSKMTQLPDNAPTFILVGDRFVREDKVLIDLDINDFVPFNSLNGNKKPSLPPELQDIDYEGWYKQQIVEEFQNSLKTNNNLPKIKPSETFLEEFLT